MIVFRLIRVVFIMIVGTVYRYVLERWISFLGWMTGWWDAAESFNFATGKLIVKYRIGERYGVAEMDMESDTSRSLDLGRLYERIGECASVKGMRVFMAIENKKEFVVMGLVEGKRFDRIIRVIADDRYGICYVGANDAGSRMSMVLNNRSSEEWESIMHFHAPFGFAGGMPLFVGRRGGKDFLVHGEEREEVTGREEKDLLKMIRDRAAKFGITAEDDGFA